MAYISARKAGERLDLAHIEVIRRLRKGDIEGRKWGWNWAITEEEVEKVKKKQWYRDLMKLRARRAQAAAEATA